jgi:small-conductance mechanosensitive channel
MPSPNLRKTLVFYITLIGIIALVLILLPLAEEFVKAYILSELGISIDASGVAAKADPDGPALGMAIVTSVSLVTIILHLVKVILGMAIVIATVRLISVLLFETVLRRSRQSEIASLLKTVLSIIIYIVSFFIIFQSEYPKVELGALFTGSTILGIVVGLALQDTLGNLFAGIAIQADQPFQVGDVVTISNRGSGVIEGVSWRGVKIRTFQNKLLVMSNSVMGKETIEVAPRNNLNARLVFFNTVYTASPSKTAQLVREAVRQIENVSTKMRPVVRIKDLGESGIDWEVKYWCENYARYNETDAQIRQRIWYVFNRESIDFAFPTRTIHIEEKPEEKPAVEVTDSRVEQLCTVPIFAPLSDEELKVLANDSVSRIFAPGETIVRQGNEGRSMFVIVRGSVKVQIPDGIDMRTVNNLSSGDFFGEMSLLTGEPRSANVVVDEETEVLQIRKSAIKPIFEGNPKLLDSIGSIIADRRAKLEIGDAAPLVNESSDEKGILRSLKNFFGMD